MNHWMTSHFPGRNLISEATKSTRFLSARTLQIGILVGGIILFMHASHIHMRSFSKYSSFLHVIKVPEIMIKPELNNRITEGAEGELLKEEEVFSGELWKEEEVFSGELLKEEVFSGELWKEKEVVSGELLKEEEVFSDELWKEKKVVLGELLKEKKVVSGELLKEKKVVSGELLKEKEVVSGELLKEEEVFSGELWKEKKVVSGELLKEKEVFSKPPWRETHRSEKTLILYWYRPYGQRMNLALEKECGNCIITDNKKKIFSNHTTAVVFHFNELTKKTMPQIRNPNHIYVYLSMESPIPMHVNSRELQKLDGQFNWTMSYRRDADVYVPLSTMAIVLNHIKTKFNHTKDAGISLVMKQKKRLVLWVVSNCRIGRGARHRMQLVGKMVNAGIKITRRGKCFPRIPPPPSTRNKNKNTTPDEQLYYFASAKFYLAFENSYHCKDYITEKLYTNAFLAGAVPIVWGAKKEDYEAVVPRHSCIFMDDYIGNLSKLAGYIDYLDQNDTAYKEYLSWRTTTSVKDELGFHNVNLITRSGREAYHNCKLCKMVTGVGTTNNPRSQQSSKKNKSVESWLLDNEETECLGSSSRSKYYHQTSP